MWENPSRKCTRFVNLTILTSSGCQTDRTFPPAQDLQLNHRIKLALIEAYGQWVQRQIDDGWDAYFFSFMFSQLPGSFGAKTQQMEREVLRWYGRLATRTVRNPRSPKWAPLLPKGVFAPDLPVYKKSKQDLRDVSINDGLHMHGIGVANRLGRISEPLDVHFADRLDEYLTSNLRHIDVERITHMAKYVTGYGMKGLKRPTFSPDNILILPKTLGELPDQKP
jgi:hypothetical protein